MKHACDQAYVADAGCVRAVWWICWESLCVPLHQEVGMHAQTGLQQLLWQLPAAMGEQVCVLLDHQGQEDSAVQLIMVVVSQGLPHAGYQPWGILQLDLKLNTLDWVHHQPSTQATSVATQKKCLAAPALAVSCGVFGGGCTCSFLLPCCMLVWCRLSTKLGCCACISAGWLGLPAEKQAGMPLVARRWLALSVAHLQASCTLDGRCMSHLA